MSSEALPAWFTAAMAAEPTRHEVHVAGTVIAAERWDGGRGTPLVLVHGGAANTGWWRFLAPELARDRPVVAMDLSGHGRSGRRERYAFPTWAVEVRAVADALAGGRSVLVGHSMGGVVVAVAAAQDPAGVAGVVVVDTPLEVPRQPRIAQAERAFARARVYTTEAAVRGSFRLLPDQPVQHPALLEVAATASIRPVEDGWTWRFDPAVFATPAADRPVDLGDTLAALTVPAATVVGGSSLIALPAERDRLAALGATPGHQHHEVPGAHHHLMFDQPLALLAVLRAVLAGMAPVGGDEGGARHG